MKAVIYTKYGPPDVLQIVEIPKPVPKPTEVLIKVHASTVNRTDCGFRSARYFISRFFTGLIKPNPPFSGSEFAGEIVDIGSEVKNYNVGDRVFGFNDLKTSSHAEYMVMQCDEPMAKIPKSFTYEQIAPAGEGATYALSDIWAVNLRKGDKVMVYGATGAIGSAAVQILKQQGMHVTAVCKTEHKKLVSSLGADKVVGYDTEDFTDTTDRYAFIFDAVGKSSYGACKTLLKKGGSYCSTELGKGGQNPFLALWFAITRRRKVIFPIPKINKEKIEYIVTLLENGTFKPLIDRTYALDRIIEATEYVETEQKVGNVVIKVI